jgi:hypothetical protein
MAAASAPAPISAPTLVPNTASASSAKGADTVHGHEGSEAKIGCKPAEPFTHELERRGYRISQTEGVAAGAMFIGYRQESTDEAPNRALHWRSLEWSRTYLHDIQSVRSWLGILLCGGYYSNMRIFCRDGTDVTAEYAVEIKSDNTRHDLWHPIADPDDRVFDEEAIAEYEADLAEMAGGDTDVNASD